MSTTIGTPWAVAKIELVDGEWQVMIMATHDVPADPVRATCVLTDRQVDRLHLDDYPCIHDDPLGGPCGNPATNGAFYCGLHSAVTNGLAVR